jgi:glycosyltransferase involved in cell wall biosynthesis
MKNLLVIGYVWPEPNSSAAGSRMLQLLEIFQQQDYQISYASPALESEHRVNLESLGVTEVSIELNNSSFDEYVKSLKPDVVLFDRFMMEEQFSWRVEKECPSALRILETVDLHCLREARQAAVKNNRNATDINHLQFHTDIALREVASILRCDLSLIISEVEVELLKNTFNISEELLHYLPLMYEPLDKEAMNEDNSKTKWPSYNEREHFVTIGNFRHAPNWDSVLYLKNSIWPLIRNKLKTAECHIYGSYPPKKAQQLHNPKQGFHIKGWADDALETLSHYRVSLSPLRFGAGMKGKLADAMLTGTPSVTTEIGAESMHAEYDWPGFIEESDDKIAESAINLYENETKWQEKQNNIFTIVNNVFNKEQCEKKFIDKFNAITNNLEEHRNNNFTGKMLRHHTMKSSMYMSQWIEAKNKLVKQ